MVVGELTTKVDLAVIGAGPGGYTAAIRAAQLGMDVVLIEKGKLGGICTNAGCIPSKALIHVSEVYDQAASSGGHDMGIVEESPIGIDLLKAQEWKDGIVRSLRDGIASLCRLNGVEIIDGRAFFNDSTSLTVETEAGSRKIEFKHAIIATGTKIKEVAGLGTDHNSVIDSDDVFALKNLPGRFLVYGGGYIAVEMASLFSRIGSRVTVVYRGERLLRQMDPEITEALTKKLVADGVEIIFNSVIARLEKDKTDGQTQSAIVKTPDGEKKIPFDKLLIATGRVVDLDGLGIEKTKVKLDQDGQIATDETCRTSDERIYAVGDVAQGPKLAHKAFRQGKIAAECIAGLKSAYDNRAVPAVVFSNPQVGVVGMTEQEAKDLGIKVKIGRMPYTALGAAKVRGNSYGFVKIVADQDDRVLGVHIVGEAARMMMGEAALAIEMGAKLQDITSTIHVHPTMSEALSECAEDALGISIHHYRGKK